VIFTEDSIGSDNNQNETIILAKAMSNNKLNEDQGNRFSKQEEEMTLFLLYFFTFKESSYSIVNK
jgi:hypothetical protein